MTYEGFVYVVYQDDGNWSLNDQLTATVHLYKVRDWIAMTFEGVFNEDEIDYWTVDVERLKINGSLTITDGNDYLHIRKVNPECR